MKLYCLPLRPQPTQTTGHSWGGENVGSGEEEAATCQKFGNTLQYD